MASTLMLEKNKENKASAPELDENKENKAEVPCAKRARKETSQHEFQSTPDAAPAMIGLTAKLASGDTLGVVQVEERCTGAILKSMLGAFVEKGKMIDGLLIGSSTFGDTSSETVKDLGLSTGAVVQVVLSAARPIAHLFRPCSAARLSMRHGTWCVGGGSDDESEGGAEVCGSNICLHGVQHKGMDSAPKIGREVAEEMRASIKEANTGPKYFQKTGRIQITCNGVATDEITVVSNPGDDTKTAILSALAIRLEHPHFYPDGQETGRVLPPGEGFKVWEAAYMNTKDWSRDVVGMSMSRDPEGSDGVYSKEAVALSDIMAKQLTQHFEFGLRGNECLSGDMLTTPRFYGGFASDGSIVGILASCTSA